MTIIIAYTPAGLEVSPEFAGECLKAFLDIGRPLAESETLALYNNLGYPKEIPCTIQIGNADDES